MGNGENNRADDAIAHYGTNHNGSKVSRKLHGGYCKDRWSFGWCVRPGGVSGCWIGEEKVKEGKRCLGPASYLISLIDKSVAIKVLTLMPSALSCH